MLSWVVLNFILFIYNNAFQLTYSLIWPTQKGHMNKVCPPFCLEVFLELAFLKQANFFKVVFCPPNGKNMLSPGFFECKFLNASFFLNFLFFFPIWSIMKVYITVIAVCLNKFHIWENSGSWDMAPNGLDQSDSGIFQSIARLKWLYLTKKLMK